MRTRRKDKSEGRRSLYRPEAANAAPDLMVGITHNLVDDADATSGVDHPVNFYAMADSAMRHDRTETPQQHLARISELWATGSQVAAANPHAWIRDVHSAEQIATPSASNRPVAAPYTKLLTSNINVDQGAAVVLCAYGVAQEHGIDDADMVFLVSGGGAHDHLTIRQRQDLHHSPAFDHSALSTLVRSGLDIDSIDHLDLYSCFPASVQLAQSSLGVPATRPFTMTGGLTFAGGPFNGYCTQALAHAVQQLRGTSESAFLYGNGGFFSKHSILIVSGDAPDVPFTYERSQDFVDAGLPRPLLPPADSGVIEGYTVTYDRERQPRRAICSVLDDNGSRHWAISNDPEFITSLLAEDRVGSRVTLTTEDNRDAHGRALPPRAHLG